MLITRRSPLSGAVNSREIDVHPADIARWKAGTLIQYAMPMVSAEDREFIKSGITPEEWEAYLGPEDAE